MVKPIKGDVMSEADEVRQLRNWLREDAAKHEQMVTDLHGKLDKFNLENQKEHKELQILISEIQTVGAVNKTKIVGLVALISVVVSGAIGKYFSA